MRVVVIIRGEFEGKAFARQVLEEDTYVFEAMSIRDRGDSYLIIPREDQKPESGKELRFNWNKGNVKFIGVFS